MVTELSRVLAYVFLFVLSVFALLPVAWEGDSRVLMSDLDIYVVVRSTEKNGEAYRYMIEDLGCIKGVQIDVAVYGNTTGKISQSISDLTYWLNQFSEYEIVVQADYKFTQYAYWGGDNKPFWIYPSTACYSQQFYDWWYGSLTSLLAGYPNVKAFVGYNEPTWHFETKELMDEVLKREYTTWKNLTDIPFSTEFTMPYVWWAEVWDFPSDPSLMTDVVPYWANYSDYIGFNLWADPHSPAHGFDKHAQVRAREVVDLLEGYGREFGKPLFCDEFPAWWENTFKYVVERVCRPPNKGFVYSLWNWKESEERSDGWIYGLYNMDKNTLDIVRCNPSWYVFKNVLSGARP